MPAVRLVTLAQDAVVLLALRGRDAMRETIAARRDVPLILTSQIVL